MKYVHYWHFQRAWYFKVNDNPNPEKVYWHNSGAMQKYWDEECLIEDSAWLTHREVREKLNAMYPEYALVKDRPFHQGARWSGYKRGSRV